MTMTRIKLSDGSMYVLEKPAQEILEGMKHSPWIFFEDNGRDIAVRTDHIIALEEDNSAIIEAYKAMEENE